MKCIPWCLAIVMITTLSCDENNEQDLIKKSSAKLATPAWEGNFPAVVHGATTADLHFATEKSSTIYYVISNSVIELTPEKLTSEAAAPSLPSISHHGILQINADESSIESIKKLSEHSRYYGYFLALPEEESVTEHQVINLEFTTEVRQDTLQFHSSFEQREVDYLLYRPEEAIKNPEKKYPVIFFLGGYGEKASPSKRINIISNGLLPESIHKGTDVPMIVMSIQHIHEVWKNELVNEAMDHAFEKFPIDENRVYLVGTSGGAFGVWKFAQAFPKKVTAIVPISGGGDKKKACQLTDIGIWAFTNLRDPLVSPGLSISMINAVNRCQSSREAKLDIFPDTGHDCWRRVFDKNHPDWSKSPQAKKPDIFEWLLSQRRATSN